MKSFIKRFAIEGLFGNLNVKIDFDENAKIIVGENGCGKTTILNIVYYTLCNNDTEFLKLKYYDFQNIIIVFGDGVEVRFCKKDIIAWESVRLPLEIRRLYRFLSPEKVQKIIDDIQENRNIKETQNILEKYSINVARFKKYVDDISEQEKMKNSMQATRKIIREKVPGKVLYLPTFRRIEDDLKSLDVTDSYTKKLSAEIGINFGMKDVENLLEKTIKKIQESYRNGFSKIFTEIMFDFYNNKEMKNVSLQDTEAIITIINRMDDTLIVSEEKEKIINKIRQYVQTDLENQEYNYFLNKLLFVFEEQMKIESVLHQFAQKCNHYLINKEVIIDKNTLELSICEKKGMHRKIELEKLSSGEKQIVALFAKLFLDDENNYIVLFDEPEISLSIRWQQTYLEDIYSMEKCKFLLAVTHSPFVFDNNLDQYAVSIASYIEEK